MANAIASRTSAAVSRHIHSVQIRSNLSPPIELTGGQASGSEPWARNASNFLLGLAKPQIVLDTTLGPIEVAPWGRPSGAAYPLVMAGMIVGSAVLLGLIVRGIRR
jgi:hypothetical protein